MIQKMFKKIIHISEDSISYIWHCIQIIKCFVPIHYFTKFGQLTNSTLDRDPASYIQSFLLTILL